MTERAIEPSARNVEIAALDLMPHGLQFKSSTVEAEYRPWQIEEGLPMTRLALKISIFNWVAALTCLWLVDGRYRVGFAIWVLGLQVPALLGMLLLTHRTAKRGWITPSIAVTNAMAGLTCVAACFWSLDRPEISTAAVIVVSQFAFTIFPLRFEAAFASVLLFVGFHEVLVIDLYLKGRLDWGSTLFFTLGAVVALTSGALASGLIERSRRQRFRQTRIIEIQSKTIERERARADVAERSRELSEALTRLTERGAVRLSPGDLIENRFKVVTPLGRGGMGEVHEVEQLSDGKRLALKVLTGKIDREALMRFAREAQIGASIDHPNVVEVVEVGVSPAGMFLVMELVAGRSLDAARARFGEVAWARPVLRQIAEALASMHARGVIHRDLKLGNILLDGDTPKITDFGISSLSETAPVAPVDAEGATQVTGGELALTRTGAMLGTPLYMAPELTMGSQNAKPAADVWAFGVIAYELLTGSHPFAEAPVLARLGGRPVPAPKPLEAELPASVRALIESCLALDPEARPSAAMLRAAL